MKNKPAFPVEPRGLACDEHSHKDYDGLTKREWFAGMALQGILSNKSYLTLMSASAESEGITTYEIVTDVSKGYADAMLQESEKGNT